MKLSTKLFLTALLGISALVALFFFKSASKEYYTNRNTIELAFKEIDASQQKLDHAILTNAFFLYTNQDEVIHSIEDVQNHLNPLLNDDHFIQKHQQTHQMLLEYQKAFETKINAIYDFQTTNTVIKNSTAAIPLLQEQLLISTTALNEEQQNGLRKIAHLSGALLVAKNAMDAQLIESFRRDIDSLSSLHFANTAQENTHQRLISHFKVILRAFPLYSEALNQINDRSLDQLLEESKQKFLKESTEELKFVTYFSYFLITLFIASIALITLFLIRSEREGRTDRLTGLQNRKAYEERINHSKVKLNLILINIRKFKHYNDFYGVAEGDKLLIQTAMRIRILPFKGVRATYYRLGADDFGILFDSDSQQSLDTLAVEVLSEFSKIPIVIDGEIRTPSIVVAASGFKPLLETADMALKSTTYANPVIYHEGLNLRQVIHDNVIKVQELKEALNAERIVPYFQPIVDLSTCQATKHEVLARVIMKNGEIRSIFPYLTIAKESNLYPQITKTIISQSFAVIAEHAGDFSINLSIEDIGSNETVEMIEHMLDQYPNIGKRIIFEILESEAIEEYEGIVNFITRMRRYGCRIAIDDFGSGYSNFSRILNLTIDIIKIDGSLIRTLDTDDKAITIVQTIVNFTKSASIQTVAEFVHNKAIAHIVSELGIDAAQGFYFYEPAPHPLVIGTLKE
jgi:diguanylate cyclase (GGDEF)-like protein